MTPPARTTKVSESILEELWFGEDDAHAITAQAAASFAAALADLEGLRPFSEVARRVLDQVNGEDFEVGRLQEIIEQDPALATKVLRLAHTGQARLRAQETGGAIALAGTPRASSTFARGGTLLLLGAVVAAEALA